jgi:hypothetical protein
MWRCREEIERGLGKGRSGAGQRGESEGREEVGGPKWKKKRGRGISAKVAGGGEVE